MNLIRASPSFECHTCFYPRVKCFHHKFTPESCCFGGIRGRKTTSLLEHHLPPEWCHTWDCESASCLSALLRVFPSTWGRSCSPHGASVRTDPNGGKDKKLTEKKNTWASLHLQSHHDEFPPQTSWYLIPSCVRSVAPQLFGVCAHLCFGPSGHFLLQHRGGRDGTLAEADADAAAAGSGPPVNPSLGCLCVNPHQVVEVWI